MKTLVTYYSRSGHTREAAQEIAKNIKADIDEIHDNKSRSGIFGWLGGGRDAATRKTTEIKYDKDPKNYDLVVVGTPIWAGNMAPAIRTYMNNNKLKKTAFFCTCGGSKGKSFDEMEKLSGRPLATLELRNRDGMAKIGSFSRKLTA